MKRIASIITAAVFVVATVAVAAPQPASAATSSWRVDGSTKTCLTAWDHIDRNGNPYGKK